MTEENNKTAEELRKARSECGDLEKQLFDMRADYKDIEKQFKLLQNLEQEFKKEV